MVDKEAERVGVALEAPKRVGLAVEVGTPVVGVAIAFGGGDGAEVDKALFPLAVLVVDGGWWMDRGLHIRQW